MLTGWNGRNPAIPALAHRRRDKAKNYADD